MSPKRSLSRTSAVVNPCSVFTENIAAFIKLLFMKGSTVYGTARMLNYIYWLKIMMNPKLQKSLDYLIANHENQAVLEKYRSIPRRKEGFIVTIADTRHIYTFSDECLEDHDENALCSAVGNMMFQLAKENINMEVFLNRELEAVVQYFEV